MCIPLNNAFCCLYNVPVYRVFEIKSATYFTTLSFIEKVIKLLPNMAEIFITEGSIE